MRVSRSIAAGFALSMMVTGIVGAVDAAETFTVSVGNLHIEADGYSEFVISSSKILRQNGTSIPDGTVFTVIFGNDGTDELWQHHPYIDILTIDADAGTAGVQVTSSSGIVRVVARAGIYAGAVTGRIESNPVEGIVHAAPFSFQLERHTPFILDALTVVPEAPTTQDAVKVRLQGKTSTPSWLVTVDNPKRYSQDGRDVIELNIASTRSLKKDDFVVQTVKTYSEEKMLPVLTEAKTYLLRIYQNGTLIKEHEFVIYPYEEPLPFSDITDSYWAVDYIRSLWGDKIISGYADGTFKPENSIRRGELLKIVMNGAGVTIQRLAQNPFTDVPEDAWYRDYVLTADQTGIATGYTAADGKRSFSPEQPITRAEALKILFRAFEIPTVRVRESNFDDTVGWQNEYVETAVAFDLAHGYGNRTFGPNRAISRAEASKIIERARKLNADAKLGKETDRSGSGAEISESGKASYYGNSLAGHSTASGEIYDPLQFTTAHKSLPFGTKIRVTNTENNKSVDVTVTDRGPYVEGRILDLSTAAFEAIGNLSRGIIDVVYSVIK